MKATLDFNDHCVKPVWQTEQEAFVQAAFMKPLKKASEVQVCSEQGKADERPALEALQPHLDSRSQNLVKLSSELEETGSIERKDKPFSVTSPDGIAYKAVIEIHPDKEPIEWDAFVELKTPGGHLSRKNAQAVAAEVDAMGDRVIFCSFGDQVFKKIVSNSGCRVQMIHHSAVLQLEFGMFVEQHCWFISLL